MTLAGWIGKIRNLLPQQIPGPIAVLYEKVAAPGLWQFYQQVAGEIASSLCSGTVLDVGTGPGHLLVEIAKRNPNLEIVGFDMSRKMLKIAKKLTEQDGKVSARTTALGSTPTTISINAGSRLVRLVRGDVRNLPFPDGAFELVVSTLSMHHWHNPAKGIRECLRVTAPGGRCWIYDLRTDVPARTLAKLVTGEKLSRLALSWIFKFHGVDPKQYQARTVASWLGSSVTVQAEVHAAYLRLNIEKPLYRLQDKTMCSKRTSSVSSVAPSI
jgi:ubiquinone/menaquinone biosynthesis C-methylase UbiE